MVSSVKLYSGAKAVVSGVRQVAGKNHTAQEVVKTVNPIVQMVQGRIDKVANISHPTFSLTSGDIRQFFKSSKGTSYLDSDQLRKNAVPVLA